MPNRRTLLAAVAVFVFTAGVSRAWAAKPDFSGTWKLNSAKSDFGPIPAPDKWERKVTHQDPSLKYTTTQAGQQGEMTTDTAFTTDGKETTNKMFGQDMKGAAKWDGDNLRIDQKGEFQGNEISIAETWALSPDGKVLTISRKINSPQGELEMKLVADKQ